MICEIGTTSDLSITSIEVSVANLFIYYKSGE